MSPRYNGVSPRLPVRDLDRTVHFYVDVLGFAIDLWWPEGEPTFAMLTREDVWVQFWKAEEQDRIGDALLYFEVDDARALHASLAAQVPIEWGPEVYWYGRRELAIRDPDGYQIVFSEATTDPVTCEER